jgi:hypothetical protein
VTAKNVQDNLNAGNSNMIRIFRPSDVTNLGHQEDPVTPLFRKDVHLMFRLSRQRFELLAQEIMHQKHFQPKKNLLPGSQASIYAKLLLPLNCLAYGAPLQCFTDYFQMSRPDARDCCNEFGKAVKTI